MARKLKGSIIIPAGLQVWEHELKTAEVLAQRGYIVEFVAVSTHYKIKSADIVIDGVLYEIKSPVASKLSAVERNLKRAYHQSVNIVFDSRRMKYLPDKSIQKELVKQFVLTKNIKSILLVNRKQEVIDISTLV
jgi:hypothetical protein